MKNSKILAIALISSIKCLFCNFVKFGIPPHYFVFTIQEEVLTEPAFLAKEISLSYETEETRADCI